MCRLDISGNDEIVIGRVERPEVRAKNHDAEVDIHIIVTLLHTLFKLICEIFAQAHVWKENLASVMSNDSVKARTCEHALQFVGVFETASFLQLGDHARLAFI